MGVQSSAIFRVLITGLTIFSCVVRASETDATCSCDDDNVLLSIYNILSWQRFSDLLIALAYFSIPIELVYFVSSLNVPFRWVFFEFIAFIVLCGMTHFLNGLSYGPHGFELALFLMISKILTAVVSCATAISLVTLIPWFIKAKVREALLRQKTADLGREVDMKAKRKEAGRRLHMLLRQIRKSLDRHSILYRTVVGLPRCLGLQRCAVWMPNDMKTELNVTHQLSGNVCSTGLNHRIPIGERDVLKFKENGGVIFLEPDSAIVAPLGGSSRHRSQVAAIRIPLLRLSNFRGSSQEIAQDRSPDHVDSYGILVLIPPAKWGRSWTSHDVEIISVLADQVGLALSHAMALEELKLMRGVWEKQKRALQDMRLKTVMAMQARNTFMTRVCCGVKRPLQAITGSVSMLQDGGNRKEQRVIINSIMSLCDAIPAVMNDIVEVSRSQSTSFDLEVRPFDLRSLMLEMASIANCLCFYRGIRFSLEIDKSLHSDVLGDERRVLQVFLYMLGKLIWRDYREGSLVLRICHETLPLWREGVYDSGVPVRFEIEINDRSFAMESSLPTGHRNRVGEDDAHRTGFFISKKLIQMMQGKIWSVLTRQGVIKNMDFALCLRPASYVETMMRDTKYLSHATYPNPHLFGLKVLLTDADGLNRVVIQQMLERIGCIPAITSSGSECIRLATKHRGSRFKIVVLDLHVHDLDGLEVAWRILKFRGRCKPLIVAVTTIIGDELWDHCLDIGIKGILRKPSSIHEVENELLRVLENERIAIDSWNKCFSLIDS